MREAPWSPRQAQQRMTKRKDKVYKEAVAKLTATVNALGNGSWQGSGGPVVHPTPAPQPTTPKPKAGRR